MMPRQTFDLGAETGQDAALSRAVLQSRLETIDRQVRELGPDTGDSRMSRARLEKEASWVLLDLMQNKPAWERARPWFDAFFHTRSWEDAIEICEILFLCNQPGSLPALGQGVWLSVTFPVNLKTTLSMLQHVIDETPPDADGAAVAAATAVHVYHLRKNPGEQDELYVDAMQMLTTVGRRHAGVHGQADFDAWIERMELDNPEKFLVRLRNVIDVLVQDDWWFDRAQVQSTLP